MCQSIIDAKIKLDYLVLNAATWPAAKADKTVDNIDLALQVNHLSQWLITWLLKDNLNKDGRVVFVCSALYKSGGITIFIMTFSKEF